MKYGIDINNIRILNAISHKLKESGNFVVDLSEGENTGKTLLRKVLVANVTNIDFYIGMEFKKDASVFEIFYDNNEKSKECSEMVKQLLNKDFKNVIFQKGERLYLLKNINAPAIYIKIPLKDEDKIEKLYIEGIVNVLANIKI